MNQIFSRETIENLKKVLWKDYKNNAPITFKICNKWMSLKSTWGTMIFYFHPELNLIRYRFVSDKEYFFNKEIQKNNIRINSQQHFDELFEKFNQLSQLKISADDFWKQLAKLNDKYG